MKKKKHKHNRSKSSFASKDRDQEGKEGKQGLPQVKRIRPRQEPHEYLEMLDAAKEHQIELEDPEYSERIIGGGQELGSRDDQSLQRVHGPSKITIEIENTYPRHKSTLGEDTNKQAAINKRYLKGKFKKHAD